jgi:membrane-bound lytic murein transglycosylase D
VAHPEAAHEGWEEGLGVDSDLALGTAYLTEPGPVVEDEIFGSPMARDPAFQEEVARWVDFWRTRGARWFPEYLDRMSLFSGSVDATLGRKGLPPSLRYLPIIESGYSPRAVSRASAVGLWQFMAPTAEGFGMRVGPLLDERRDPFKSTEAAGDFLLQLREQFGSWFLALAAYNSGPYRVQRILDLHAPLAPRSDSLYWAVREHLPRETQDFVPKFFAAALVAGNPRAHGFEAPPESVPFVFDEVVVPDATTLDVVARAAGATQEEIERLNPELVRGITPPGRETILRVPLGSGWSFRDAYDRIPPEERVSYVEHRLVRGETLSHVALRYGVRMTDLRAANPGLDPRRLQIGTRLTVPIAPRR